MSCKPPNRVAALHRAIAEAHLALAAHLEGDEDDEAPPAPLPPLPKVKQRRGPRIPRGIVPTDEQRELIRKMGGIFGE
jgi:hypothetical protein